MIHDLIQSALILPALGSTPKRAVLDQMLDAAVADDKIDAAARDAIRRKLLDREKNGSTGIGNGVAVPHVKHGKVARMVLVFGRSVPGIDFDAVDGREVHSVFMLLAPQDAAEDHLQVLRWVSGLARNADFRRFALSAEGEAELRDLLEEMSREG